MNDKYFCAQVKCPCHSDSTKKTFQVEQSQETHRFVPVSQGKESSEEVCCKKYPVCSEHQPSFTSKTLEEFREQDWYGAISVSLTNVIEQWFSSKLEEAREITAKEYLRAGKALGILEGKRNERNRILALLESMEKRKEADFGDTWEGQGWFSALTALKEEIEK